MTMPPIYPSLSILAAVATVVLELAVFRTGLFRQVAYWISLAICVAFMIPVDGWLTKYSAPIVVYRPEDTSEWTPIWNILGEEYLYAFALLTMVMVLWDWSGRRSARVEADQR